MDDEKVETKKSRFSPKDFNTIAEYIVGEWKTRKDNKDRKHRETVWDEIDRQLRMEPDLSHKMGNDGSPDSNKAWMPELELPLQSETLEVLTADARRMMFGSPWYAAHAAMTDKYLDRVDFQSLIAGDESEVPSRINQDNADKLVQGWLDTFHKQYDFWGNVDLINGEAFKYGTGIGRSRIVSKRVFIDTAKGVLKETIKMPVLFPVSIRDTYLDDNTHNIMNEGQMIGPSVIFSKRATLADIRLSAQKGKNNPKDPDGGWMIKNFKGVEPDEDGTVQLVEYEGDLVVPKKSSGSIFIPGAIATVLVSAGPAKVVRFRLRKEPFSTYTIFPYHREEVKSPYGVGPLMKGMPIQKAATLELINLMSAGILNIQPPISYDRSDPQFAQEGGPVVFPSALWGTISDVKMHQIGESGQLLNVYVHLLQQYADVTGVNAPRLGAQTKSHTTAFAKEAELSRGTSRTVDYVESTLSGGMNEWLSKEFYLGRESMGKRKDTIYIDAYRGFAEITKEHLPDEAVFDVFGANGPAEKQAQAIAKQNSMQQAIQIEIGKREAGLPGRQMDLDAVQEEILREGGWLDVTPFFKQEVPQEPNPIGPGEAVPVGPAGPITGTGILTGDVNG